MSEITAERPAGKIAWRREWPAAIVAAVGVVATGDLLFWDDGPGGFGLFLFFIAAGFGVLVASGTRRLTPAIAGGLILTFLGALPFLEATSIWALLSATFGVSMLALATGRLSPSSPVDLPAILVRFGIPAPFRLAADAFAMAVGGAELGVGKKLVQGVLIWILPLVLAVVFVALFAAANPLIESALMAVNLDDALRLLQPDRFVFWFVLAAFVWPLLVPKLLSLPSSTATQPTAKAESLLFGRGAILRALIVFNLIFAVQSVLDLTYLWGGLALPDGMTYAQYAHRGAYPLIVTALLAAAFVLAAMRPGGLAEQSIFIRRLVYVFISQNVLLVVSSILRLDLYVEVYSLTELRVAAGIWMGLVAVGLILILARIALQKSNKWLVAANLASLGITLYLCAFVDIEGLIARFNVEHSKEMTGQGAPLDLRYLEELGPSALPALDGFIAQTQGRADIPAEQVRLIRARLAGDFLSRDRDWRKWSFRSFRLDQYLSGGVAQAEQGARTGVPGS